MFSKFNIKDKLIVNFFFQNNGIILHELIQELIMTNQIEYCYHPLYSVFINGEQFCLHRNFKATFHLETMPTAEGPVITTKFPDPVFKLYLLNETDRIPYMVGSSANQITNATSYRFNPGPNDEIISGQVFSFQARTGLNWVVESLVETEFNEGYFQFLQLLTS